jgi:hypothetical protein
VWLGGLGTTSHKSPDEERTLSGTPVSSEAGSVPQHLGKCTCLGFTLGEAHSSTSGIFIYESETARHPRLRQTR